MLLLLSKQSVIVLYRLVTSTDQFTMLGIKLSYVINGDVSHINKHQAHISRLDDLLAAQRSEAFTIRMSVCPSVRPSVCHTRELRQNGSTYRNRPTLHIIRS